MEYKVTTDKKRCPLEFEEGDFVWAILTKDRFPIGEYNKLAARKIRHVEIVKKINANAYQLSCPAISELQMFLTSNILYRSLKIQ